MQDLLSVAAGGRVLLATSGCPDHPAEHAIDGQDETFWFTTGLFPQEIMAELAQPAVLAAVRLVSAHIRHIRVEGCFQDAPRDFGLLAEHELEEVGGCLQVQEVPCQSGCRDTAGRGMWTRGARRGTPQRTRYLRLMVLSGWRDFCSVHKLEVCCTTELPVMKLPSEPSVHMPQQATRDEPGALITDSVEAARRERRMWLDRVARDGWYLAEAPEELRGDREVVLAAVGSYGLALEHASEELRGDMQVVMAALNQDPWAGQFMAETLTSPPEEPTVSEES